LFAGTGFGVFRSTDSGANWTSVDNGLTNPNVNALTVSGTNLIAGTMGGVFRTSDYGTSWTQVSSGLTNVVVDAFAVSGQNLFAGGDSGAVYSSTDNGTNWRKVSNRVGNSSFVSALLGYTASGGTGSTRLFAGTDIGIFVSVDSGTTWRITGATGNLISALAVDGTNLFASSGGGVLRSTNDGSDWTPVINGLDFLGLVHSLTVSGSNVFAGTWGGGVFLSTDSGNHWTGKNDGLRTNNIWINSLVVSGTHLFAGTRSDPLSSFGVSAGGVYSRPLTEMITAVGLSRGDAPALFRLEQNYPNPFNPTTTIRYALPQRSLVTLTVFNSLGQALTLFLNGEQDAGYHEVKFDGAGLASGVYFYRLRAGEYVETKKLLLIH
jgi:photosystem II stability/assembly factor-like uncharacterized protein